MPELLDILFEAESRFYVRKLIDLANNRNICVSSRYNGQNVTIKKEQISKIADGLYHVESESNPGHFYRVCTSSGTCECVQGRNRGPCKHKDAIHHYFGEAAFNVVPTHDPSTRRLWNFIATGKWLPESWFRNFRESQASRPTQSHEETHDADDVLDDDQNDDENISENYTAVSSNDSVSQPGLHGDNVQNEAAESLEPDNEDNTWEQDEQDFRSAIEEVIKAAKEGYEKKDTNIIKGFQCFSKRLKRSVTNKQILSQNMFSYGSETDDVLRGKRIKKGDYINVQPSSKNRRLNQEPGRRQAERGSRLAEVEENARVQRANDNSGDDGIIYSTLPNKKKKKNNSQKHSLKLATQKNISAARKH